MKNNATPAAAKAIQPFDKLLFWAVIVLAAFGVAAVYSAIGYLAAEGKTSTEGFLIRHTARVGVAIVVLIACSRIDYRWMARNARKLLIGLLVLLLLVPFVGVLRGGAVRSFDLGLMGFQPSELAKVALLLHVAYLLARKQTYIESFSRAFAPIFFWILVTVVLIGMQDLSTAAIVFSATVLMCFVGRVRLLHLSGLAVVVLGLGLAFLLNSPERQERLINYPVGRMVLRAMNVEIEPEGASRVGEGYQARQARIAFAMGGLMGVGPGKSTQRDFLPAPYNDFIFAIIAEEYGLLMALAVIAGFVFLLIRGFHWVARSAADPLGLILGVGLTTMVVLYGFVHAGVACGLLPVTGLPMPFVSYGGTSVVANGMMIGILLNISRNVRVT